MMSYKEDVDIVDKKFLVSGCKNLNHLMDKERQKSIVMIIFKFLFLILLLGGNLYSRKEPDVYKKQRYKMVEEQIVKRGVSDRRVISALKKVERHKFVPKNLQRYAYDDGPLPIGEGQTISQPYIVALMTELLELKKTDRVLEIGTGSGYQAAILAEICNEVYTIEIIPKLGLQAEALLKELGYKNIKVKIGDGYLGWQEFAPYDKIIITCAPTEIPPPLIEQLKEGGIIVAPLGDFFQELVVARKIKGKIHKRSVIPVRFVPMLRK